MWLGGRDTEGCHLHRRKQQLPSRCWDRRLHIEHHRHLDHGLQRRQHGQHRAGPKKNWPTARASPDDFGSFFSYTATTTADKPKLAFVRVVGRDCLSYNVDYYSDVLGNFDVYVDTDACPMGMETTYGGANPGASFSNYITASGATLIARNTESTHTASCPNPNNDKINEEKGIPNVGIHSADSEVNAINKLDNAAATSFAWWKDYHVNGVRPCPDAPGGRCVTIPQSPTLKYCISVVQKPGITFPAAYTPNNGYTSYAQTGITSPNAFPWFAPITPAIVRQKLSNYAFIGPEDGRYVPVDGTDIDQMMKYETPNSARWLVLAEVQAYPMGDIQQCTEWSWTCVREDDVCDGNEPPTPTLSLSCGQVATPVDLGGSCGTTRPECGGRCTVPCTTKKVCAEWEYKCKQSVASCPTCAGARPDVPNLPANEQTNTNSMISGGSSILGGSSGPSDRAGQFQCQGIAVGSLSSCDVRYPQACTASGAAQFSTVTDATAFSRCYKSNCKLTCQNS